MKDAKNKRQVMQAGPLMRPEQKLPGVFEHRRQEQTNETKQVQTSTALSRQKAGH